MAKAIYFVSAAFLALVMQVCSLNMDLDVPKQRPFSGDFPVASHINYTWLQSEEIWYFPFVTRSNIVLMTKNFLSEEEYQKISIDEAREKMCCGQTWKTDFQYEFFAFGKNLRKSSKLRFNPDRPGVIDWENHGDYKVTTYFLMTDNKKFVVGTTVFPDGRLGGYVMTPYSNVTGMFSEEQVAEWETKLEEVGFGKRSLVRLPTNCARTFWEKTKAKNQINL